MILNARNQSPLQPSPSSSMLSPFGDDPVNNTSTWRPEPDGRGTWGILSSCILTILLCVWSAVHLNVPQHRKTWAQYVRKLKWLLIALFAPEIVVYVAWQQRNEASRLLKISNTTWGRSHADQNISPSGGSSSAGSPAPSKKSRQTEHLCLRSTQAPHSMLPGRSCTASTLSWAALPFPRPIRADLSSLHRTRALPLLQKASVSSSATNQTLYPTSPKNKSGTKSKADGLKKTIVCAQALWFYVQCFTRLAQSLPVSLLKVNTFAHSLCTLLVYILWWDKPLDVEEPTEVKDSRLFPVFAYMWMTSRTSAQDYSGHDIGRRKLGSHTE